MAIAADKLLRLNGCPLSWTSTRSTVNSIPYVGFQEINIEESREGELVHGQQGDGVPLGITSGLYKVDALSFKILHDTCEMIFQSLAISISPTAGPAALSYGDARFIYQLEIFEPQGPAMLVTVNGCKVEKRKIGASKTETGALVDEVECKALTVQTVGSKNGLTGLVQQLYSVQRGLV